MKSSTDGHIASWASPDVTAKDLDRRNPKRGEGAMSQVYIGLVHEPSVLAKWGTQVEMAGPLTRQDHRCFAQIGMSD
jgi:hypothetical protein